MVKKPQDQKNEEKIGSLPEKEFIVMIVKMIQNLENKIEAQKKQTGGTDGEGARNV